MNDKGFSTSNIQSKLKYHSLNLGPWGIIIAMTLLNLADKLSSNNPVSGREWIILIIQAAASAVGPFVAFVSARKIAQ